LASKGKGPDFCVIASRLLEHSGKEMRVETSHEVVGRLRLTVIDGRGATDSVVVRLQ
jgi:hypothetical protein